MTGQELQAAASFISILKTLAGNDNFLIIVCLTMMGIVVIPSVFAFKAIKALSAQIIPLREEIGAGRTTFASLILGINNQKDVNKEIIRDQRILTERTMELVERVTKALVRLEKRIDKEAL